MKIDRTRLDRLAELRRKTNETCLDLCDRARDKAMAVHAREADVAAAKDRKRQARLSGDQRAADDALTAAEAALEAAIADRDKTRAEYERAKDEFQTTAGLHERCEEFLKGNRTAART